MNPTPTVAATSVRVRSLTPGPTAMTIKRRYEETFGDPPAEPGGWYRDDDWRRTSHVLDQLRSAANVLDVGAGAGQFANMLAASGKFGSVTALDHIRFGKYSEFSELITRADGSIAELPFADDEFEVVTCMEVLEHVPDEVFLPGIAELRRVCGGQLVMSVPFEEQEPLSKGHLRRFEAADIARLFPDAQLTLLDRPRMPWMIIEERCDGSAFAPPTVGESTTLPTQPLTDEGRRIRALEAEVARLQARKSLRAANWLGTNLRRGRDLVTRRSPS